MKKVDRVMEIAKRLIEVEGEQKSLRSELGKLVGDSEDGDKASAPNPLLEKLDEMRGAGAPARILGVLSAEPARSFRAADLKKALPDLEIKLIRNTMTRLNRDEKVKGLSRGLYQAKEA